MMEHMGGMGGMMLLWGLVGLVGLALLGLAVVAMIWLVRHMITGARSRPDAAWDELRRRHAAGEIEQEEFARLRREIRDW